MTETPNVSAADRARIFLILSSIVTLVLYFVPGGRWVAYPLMLLSTLVHEMGHGIAAVLIGGDFESFKMWRNGSGVAAWSGNPGRIGRAIVSAGGLVGPAIGGMICFLVGRKEAWAQKGLAVFGGILVLALILVVRNLFGVVFVGTTAAICLLIALRAKPWVAQVTMVFLGTQLALSVFSRGDYLFTDVAQTSAGRMPSDVAQMADALFLPYWFWGAVCGLFSVGVLLLGLRAFFKEPK